MQTSSVSSHATSGDVSMVMSTIEDRAEMFEKRFRTALNSSTIDVQKRDKYRDWVRRLEDQVDEVTDAHKRGDADGVRDDIKDILKIAARVDEFMAKSDWTDESEETWRTLREDINILARAHGMSALGNHDMMTASR
jgi:hypothetical protein